MLSVADALHTILEHCQPLPAQPLPLSPSILGSVLAEDILSDLDMPPFDKSLMDGYAVRSSDAPAGKAILDILEELSAGKVPSRDLAPGQATRIMTGAPIPPGADAVVPIEKTHLLQARQVELRADSVKPGQNILLRGREMKQGECVLPKGTVLRPQELGVLATVGRTVVQLTPPPRVALLATGDELIEPDQVPGPGQIRNSNASMLLAQSARAGSIPRYLGIARDSLDSLRPLVLQGLETSEILVLSGGVSAGKLDLVPDLLREVGVVAHFHKVQMKPGKPLFFGSYASPSGKRLVFGLPGNPVSSFVCFELFLLPAIRRLAGHPQVERPRGMARLLESFRHQSDRPTYHPATLSPDASGWTVQPVRWFGSADLRALLGANALLLLPPGERTWQSGETVETLWLEC